MGAYEEVRRLNRGYFEILQSLFRGGLGCEPAKFSTMADFPKAIRSLSEKQGRRLWDSLCDHEPQIRTYYDKNAVQMFSLSKGIGGLKYVIGGGSHFGETQYSAVKNMLLYGDTILVPDPVLPWFETDRPEEKFRHVLPVQQVFTLLHLKPLIDADLPYPPVVVFPSFEKSLELRDQTTKSRIERAATAFFSYYLEQSFTSVEDTLAFAKEHPETFLTAVEKGDLFWAPGQVEHQSIADSIEQYRSEIRQWRSEEYQKKVSGMGISELVWIGIFERLVPQYHWLENVDEFEAAPLACIEGQWQHFKLFSNMLTDIVAQDREKSSDLLESYVQLNAEPFEWLGNLSITDIVELRKQGANESFRLQVKDALNRLRGSAVQDSSRIAAEISRTIRSSIESHQKEVKEINGKYIRKYGSTLFAAAIGIPALFLPALAPLAGTIAPIAVGGKLIWDLGEHMAALRKSSRSMLGIFARIVRQSL